MSFNYHVDLKINVNVFICMPWGYMESGTELHTFTFLGCKCCMVSFISWPFCLWGRNTWFSLNGRLGGPQSWCEHFGEDKNLFPLPGIIPQFLSHSACRIITILNELCSLPVLILCEINCMLSDI